MFATIYLPNFYLQAALRHQTEQEGKPVALIDDQAAKAVIIELNQTAHDLGVRSGMTPSQGLARHLSLIVKTRLRAQEKLLNELLLHFGYALAPYVEATGPGLCTVQFTEMKNVQRHVTRVVEQLRAVSITAQGGIAHTPDTSLLAAHLAKPVLQIDDAKDFLAPLPIETLALA